MSPARPIALTGLFSTEQVLLEGALFQQGGSQIPGALLVNDLSQAELIIANADDASAVRALQARALPGRVLLLGASDAGTGWPVVPRPLRLHAMLEAVRRVLTPPAGADVGADEAKPVARAGGWLGRFRDKPTGFDDTQPFMPGDAIESPDFESTRQLASSVATPRPFEATLPFMMSHGDSGAGAEPARVLEVAHGEDHDFASTKQLDRGIPSVAPSDWDDEPADWARVRPGGGDVAEQDAPASSGAPEMPGDLASEPGERPASVRRPVAEDRILIVGQPGTAAGGLLKSLQSAGFPADFAPGAEAAFRNLAQRPYQFVFLIEVSLGPQAITLCQAIRDNRGVSPGDFRLVIVASHSSLLSRIRAWFAGCHAWMPIPLSKTRLLQYLQQNRAGGPAPG